MKFINIFIVLTLLAFSSNAQKLSVDLFADYNLLYVSTRIQVNSKYLIYNSPVNFDGFRIGVRGSLKVTRGFWSLESAYFQNQSAFTFVNITPDEDPRLGIVWYSREEIYSNRRFDINFNRGLRLTSKIYGEIGILGCYWLKDDLAGEPDDYFEQFESLKRTKILFRFADSYEDLSLSFRVKLGYVFGPLNIYLCSEKNITPIAKGLEFNGVNYPMSQKYLTFSIGLSYLIFNKAHKK